MIGVRFSHEAVGELNLRLPPTEVSWDYKMNTQSFTTYAGEVVQALGITFNKVIFSGRFGREGAHGKRLVIENSRRVLRDQDPSQFTNWRTNEPYGVGLSQMFAYFKTYFAAASQGAPGTSYHYSQSPMKVTHSGGTDVAIDPINNKSQVDWWVYPVSFPSFKRTNENFAPEWKVECEVYEAPFELDTSMKDEIFKNYRANIGWKPMSKYSDPLGQFLPDDESKRTRAAIEKAISETDKTTDLVIDYWRNIAPAMTPLALEELLMAGASLPNVYNLNKKNRGRKNRQEADRTFGGIAGVGSPGTGGSGLGGPGPLGAGYLPGETDSAYADRNNPPPSGQGSNYGAGSAPVKYSGALMGPGSDDRHDLSYTWNKDGVFVDINGGRFDDKGRRI